MIKTISSVIPRILGGQLVIKGTRVPILASLAEGARNDEILADFPTLKEFNAMNQRLSR